MWVIRPTVTRGMTAGASNLRGFKRLFQPDQLAMGLLGISDYGNDEHIDDVSLTYCSVPSGGLVVGNVYVANTNKPVAGATVSNLAGYSTTTTSTQDPAVDDGFYTLYSPSGSSSFTAAKNGYSSNTVAVNVVKNSTTLQNIYIQAPLITITPAILQSQQPLGSHVTIPFTLTNTGSLPADFELKEMNNGSFTNMASPQKGQGKWLYQATTGIPMQSNQGKTTLAYPKAYRWTPDVVSPVQALIYADDRIHSSPDTYLDQALAGPRS